MTEIQLSPIQLKGFISCPVFYPLTCPWFHSVINNWQQINELLLEVLLGCHGRLGEMGFWSVFCEPQGTDWTSHLFRNFCLVEEYWATSVFLKGGVKLSLLFVRSKTLNHRVVITSLSFSFFNFHL